MPIPVIAIVGRPNVGKSTFFNRVIGRRQALVDPEAGLTRDRLYGHAEWNQRRVLLVDTAGLEPGTEVAIDDIRRGAEAQTMIAIEEADLILFMLDVRGGLTPLDRDLADLMRRASCPVVLVGNKADSHVQTYLAHELLELGFGDVQQISALTGIGMDDLFDHVETLLPSESEEEEAEPADARVAILGRPNVGKSSILNRLVGVERSIVSNIPGTTRDPVDTVINHEGKRILLIDTAGVRRRRSVSSDVEHYSLLRSLKAVERADVVLMVMDSEEGVAAHDRHLAGHAIEAGVGMVLVMNKWDLLDDLVRDPKVWNPVLSREFDFIAHVPWVPASAKTGRGLSRALDLALQVAAERTRRVTTRELMKVIRDAVAEHPPPSFKSRRLEIDFATQAAGLPPTFVLFVNDDTLLHFSYRRYLEKRIRAAFGFAGTPIRLALKRQKARPGR